MSPVAKSVGAKCSAVKSIGWMGEIGRTYQPHIFAAGNLIGLLQLVYAAPDGPRLTSRVDPTSYVSIEVTRAAHLTGGTPPGT